MPIKEFPPIESADENGLLAIGGDLELESLVLAYSNGIFPWPFTDHGRIPWFSPKERAVLFFEDFSPSKKLKKEYQNTDYTFAINKNFRATIQACADAKNRSTGHGTWITREMIEAYTVAHDAGIATSFECYDNDELIGGMYGISLGKMFAGESMFHKRTNTSKLCLCYAVDYLGAQGFHWMDCQQMSPLLKSFGAKEIPRDDFLLLLKKAL